MTYVLVEELGRNPEYVFVVIDAVETDNWGRKGQSLTELLAAVAGPEMKVDTLPLRAGFRTVSFWRAGTFMSPKVGIQYFNKKSARYRAN